MARRQQGPVGRFLRALRSEWIRTPLQWMAALGWKVLAIVAAGVVGFGASLADKRQLSSALLVGLGAFALAALGLNQSGTFLESARARRRPDWLTHEAVADWERPHLAVVPLEPVIGSLSAQGAWVDFHFLLVNTSIYPIQLDPGAASGRFALANTDCSQLPEVQPANGGPIMIGRRHQQELVVRQYLLDLSPTLRPGRRVPFRLTGFRLPMRAFNPRSNPDPPEERFGPSAPLGLPMVHVDVPGASG
jgi:hypothetical protein